MRQEDKTRERNELTGKAVELFLELPEDCQKMSHAFMQGLEMARRLPTAKAGRTA